MTIEISSKELLRGTRAYRRQHSEERDQRIVWLGRERLANATSDEPDIAEFLNIYGVDLLEAVESEKRAVELLCRCATSFDRYELAFWLDQIKNPESRQRLRMLFDEEAVQLYCLVGGNRVLTTQRTAVIGFGRYEYFVFPPDTSTDFLADEHEETPDPDRLCDEANAGHILSAIFAEWSYGRPKSMLARDFICSVCERAENS